MSQDRLRPSVGIIFPSGMVVRPRGVQHLVYGWRTSVSVKADLGGDHSVGDVVSPELEPDLKALSYLVTVVIRRLHDIDPMWCRDLLAELKADRMSASPGSNKLFARAIGIVEQAIAEEPPPEKTQKSALVKDGK